MKYTLDVLKTMDFGELVVLEESDKHVYPSGASQRKVLCQCSCGRIGSYNIYNLISKNTTRCKECALHLTTHGMSNTKLYRQYIAMLGRCNNPNNTSYKHYGAKGVKVSEELSESFENFMKIVGLPPNDGLKYTLDRIDPSGDYCATNIRWAVYSTQLHNKRKRDNLTSRFIGVHQDSRGKWVAQLSKDYHNTLVGIYDNEEDAATAYDNYSEIVYGDRPNKTDKREVVKNRRKSGGVTFNKVVGKWCVRLSVDGIRKHLGYFDSEERAREFLEEYKNNLPTTNL